MLTCREVIDSLSAYLDEDLRQEVVDEIRKHMALCDDCRAEFDTLNMTIKLYRGYGDHEMPPECHDRLLKVLELEKMRLKRGGPVPKS
jgi:predicted anti-sigma-YlaC factor YlaD